MSMDDARQHRVCTCGAFVDAPDTSACRACGGSGGLSTSVAWAKLTAERGTLKAEVEYYQHECNANLEVLAKVNRAVESAADSVGLDYRGHGIGTITIAGLLAERVKKAEADRDEARAIVDKLPKTSDGVPMVCGDSVFYRWGKFAVRATVVTEPELDGSRLDRSIKFYSTPEAAEAALKAVQK